MFTIPKYPGAIPFFLYDLGNNQLITNQFIPEDITDNKDIILSETPIPGLNYQPIQSGGLGNRKISLDIPLINRNDILGNVLLLKQYENLRQPEFNFNHIFNKNTQFTQNPKVLYMWGIGSIPLVYYVSKCNFTHKKHFVNSFGTPQYTTIHLELILDESNILNRAEETYRQLASILGSVQSTINLAANFVNKKAF
jgi:hypothetical protein